MSSKSFVFKRQTLGTTCRTEIVSTRSSVFIFGETSLRPRDLRSGEHSTEIIAFFRRFEGGDVSTVYGNFQRGVTVLKTFKEGRETPQMFLIRSLEVT